MRKKINPKSLENLKKRKPFVKDDPRINRQGRASNFDQLRALFQSIANEEIEYKGEKISRAAFIGLMMADDKKSMREFLEFAYGKVPLSSIVDVTSGGKPLNWKLFIDGEENDDKDPLDE